MMIGQILVKNTVCKKIAFSEILKYLIQKMDLKYCKYKTVFFFICIYCIFKDIKQVTHRTFEAINKLGQMALKIFHCIIYKEN